MEVGKSNAGCMLGSAVQPGHIPKATAGVWILAGAYSRRRYQSMLVDVIFGGISISPPLCRNRIDDFWFAAAQ